MKKEERRSDHFNERGDEYIITNPETRRAHDNFLWNNAAFSIVEQTGVGCMDYQMGQGESIQLLSGIGRICDYDVFGRDGLMSRIIYIKDEDSNDFWNLGWEPVCHDYDHFSCTHGLGYTSIENKTNGIGASLRVFIPSGDDPVELWTMVVKNEFSSPRNLSLFFYNQIQLKYKGNFDSYGDMIFRGSRFDWDLNSVIVEKHPFRKPHDYLMGFLACDREIDSYDGNRGSFVGTYNTLSTPAAVLNGRCSNTPGSSDATTAAVHFALNLQPGEEVTYNLILGAADSREEIVRLKRKYIHDMEHYFSRLKSGAQNRYISHRVESKDKYFDLMVNYWLKHGSALGARWCRWGWMGYRDIVQHGLGVASVDSERTREILLEALSYQYSHGPALRGWNPVDEKSYSDSALWLVFTLCAYLKETGDYPVLESVCPYYDKGEDTVLAHIEAALGFLESNKGAHGFCLIKFGDWNDSLTGVGKEGRGESVWLSMAYGEALREMISLYEHSGFFESAAESRERYEKIRKAVVSSAWDGAWYIRCFDDAGEPIGSSRSQSGKIFLNPQAWSIISGMADKEKIGILLDSCDDLLLTEKGYKLLAEPFYQRDDHIGRISCLEPGVCENGTIYSHVNAWMIMGLLRAGLFNRAYQLIRKILPGYHNDGNPSYMISNCYYGPEHKNRPLEMEFTWITGSLAWFNHVLINEFLGAKADYTGLRIEPRIPGEWDKVTFVRRFRGVDYHINIQNPLGIESHHYKLIVDGEPHEGNLITGKVDACRIMVQVIEEGDKNG